MASNRLYRNYTSEDGNYDVYYDVGKPHSSPPKRVQNSTSSRTLDSDRTRNDGLPDLITDDDGVTPYEDESAESDFHDFRATTHPLDSGTTFPRTPGSSKNPRRPPTSGSSNKQERQIALDDHAPASPPPKTPSQGTYRSNYELERNQLQAQVTPGDSADREMAFATQIPEFFSLKVFQMVLRNPTIAHQLLKFGQSRLCGEHMEFLAKVNKYHLLLHEVSKAISGIYEEFFADEAPKYLNVPQSVNERVNKDIKSSISMTLPKLESVFSSAQTDVERLIYGDVYPPFVRHQMSISAAKALASDRGKYAGLGDCFVLTDPSKADNPIVFASDGFVKVTGHPRKEIIPRNCRFLQTMQTDRAAVERIKMAIEKREECVELLLNEKKNGEPFWNLLYITPLFGPDGNLAFFLGGQINCSTTIHSTNDVLRILAHTNDAEEDSRTNSVAPKPPPGPSRSIRRALGSNAKSSVQQRAPGMEDSLVDKLGSMPLTSQFREFYTAYSHFLIINYSTFLIAFVSGGVVEMLFPIKAKTAYQTLAVGTDIFKFLGNHGSGSLSWDFKSSVKNALKIGQAISLELKLCAKPSLGLERFLLHWTPLKDEAGAVKWIVLTMANQQRAS